MALYYDEILAGNCFGQINVTPTLPVNNQILVDKTKQEFNLSDEFGLSIEELFYKARQFLKGIYKKMIENKFNLSFFCSRKTR